MRMSTKRPRLDDVAWVFKHLSDNLHKGGTYRSLIYERMGYGPEAYGPLYKAGGIRICNALLESEKLREWISLSDQALRLRCGEMTAQEVRTVRAVLRAIAWQD